MPNHNDIYNMEAEKYDQMVARQACLLNAVEAVRPLEGLDVIDLGAGTGRLSVPLASKAKSILSLDTSEAMLKVAADKLTGAGLSNWRTQAADHRLIPAGDGSVDLIVSGWSICYIASSNVPDWERNLEQALSEIHRVLKEDGTVIIFETMGTGVEQPDPPSFLTKYYRILEEKYGFSFRMLRTDYHFQSEEEAESLVRFFFGDELAGRIARARLSTVPEYAGMWWLHRS